MIRRLEVAVFAAAFALAGLIALALVWSGDAPYEWLARANGVSGATFLEPPDAPSAPAPRAVGLGEHPVSLETLVAYHREWSAYVTGARGAVAPSFGRSAPFTAAEYAHMADVRAVFGGAKVVLVAAVLVIAFRVQRAWARHDALRLVRDGAVAAALGVLVVGVVAAFAFEPLFLLFHEVFFPQGNFLFDPATSNLIRLYPDWYWQGITALVAGSFVAVSGAVAATCALALRKLRAR